MNIKVDLLNTIGLSIDNINSYWLIPIFILCLFLVIFLRNKFTELILEIFDFLSFGDKYRLKQIDDYLSNKNIDNAMLKELIIFRDAIYFKKIFGIYAEEIFRGYLFQFKKHHKLEWYQIRKIFPYLKLDSEQNKIIINISRIDIVMSKISFILGIMLVVFGMLWFLLLILAAPKDLSKFLLASLVGFIFLAAGIGIISQFSSVNLALKIKNERSQNDKS